MGSKNLEQRRPRGLLLLAAPFVVALCACVGGEDDASSVDSSTAAPPSSAPSPAPSPEPSPEPSPAPSPSPAPPPDASRSASLTWAANQDPDLAGYRVYFGTESGKYQQARGQGIGTRVTTHVVNGLSSATRYFFAITAVDAYGNESGFSQEVTKQIP